jgi:hypothetical protein
VYIKHAMPRDFQVETSRQRERELHAGLKQCGLMVGDKYEFTCLLEDHDQIYESDKSRQRHANEMHSSNS